MKLTKHIGCLLALVFATASAFAADWFTANLSEVTETAGARWSAAPAGWTYTGGVASFNDWNEGLTYEAEYAKETSSSNSVIKTTVKFTAIDGVDVTIPTEEMTTALDENVKAGLTIVETATDETRFYGIVNGQWTLLTGDTEDALKGPVEVKVEITKGENANYVKYTVGAQVLKIPNSDDPLVAKVDAFEIQTVTYMGCVKALSSLVAFAYGNTDAAKEEVVIDNPGTDVPSTINYNPANLAKRGVDVTSADAIKEYLTEKQGNGYLGWVNTTLGLDDTQKVAVATCEGVAGSVTVDFGFIPDQNSTITYVVGDGDASENATINTGSTGISNVTVQVTQDGTTVTVDTVQVGVMNTGKEVTEEQKSANAKVFDIIAVPFNAFSGDITVANLLNTAELTNGDTLHIPNTDGGYNVWQWNATAGAWEAPAKKYGVQLGADATTPEEEILEQGQAIWLEHDANSKIVIAGTPGTSEKQLAESVTVAAPTGDEPNWELVANPSIKPLALSTIEGNVGDQIVVEDVADPKQYEMTSAGWKVYNKVTTKKTVKIGTVEKEVTQTEVKLEEATGASIPEGIGFWYVNAGSLAVTIRFPLNVEPVAD